MKLLRLTVKEEIQLQENTIFDLDLGVKFTRNVAQFPLHHVTYSPTKFEVATSNGLGGYTFTRNVTYARTDGQTDGRTDGRRTDFDTKLIYPFFLKKKAGIKIQCELFNKNQSAPKHFGAFEGIEHEEKVTLTPERVTIPKLQV